MIFCLIRFFFNLFFIVFTFLQCLVSIALYSPQRDFYSNDEQFKARER